PVIVILTKFDDLIAQVYDISLDYSTNRENAETERKKLEASLFSYKSPPKAGVYVEDMHNNNGKHQEQVKVLIEKTAESLDDLSLKMLFVSIQQNNLELCLEYAVKYVPFLQPEIKMVSVKVDLMEHAICLANARVQKGDLLKECLSWFQHSIWE
ncbi:hypothetical protein DXG01_012477, partial [Tephrocybe rancida]